MLYQDVQDSNRYGARLNGHHYEHSKMSTEDTRDSMYSNVSNPKLLIRRGSVDDKVTVSRKPPITLNRMSSRRHSSPMVLEEIGLLGNKMLFKTVSTSSLSSSSAMQDSVKAEERTKRKQQRHLPQIEETTNRLDEGKENQEEEPEPEYESTVTWSRRGSAEGSMPSVPSASPRRHKFKPSSFIDIETYHRITNWITDVDSAMEKEEEGKEKETTRTIELPSINGSTKGGADSESESESES